MKKWFVNTGLFFCFYNSYGQGCNCPDKGIAEGMKRPIKVFQFKNEKRFGVCGSVSVQKKDTIYSNFEIFYCGDQAIQIEHDTTDRCIIEFKNDTLKISNLTTLPIGQNFKLVEVPFHISTLFFKGDVLDGSNYFRKDLPKYSAAQIKLVIEKYKRTILNKRYDNLSDLSSELFWAAISGSKEAEEYLVNFAQEFSLPDKTIEQKWYQVVSIYYLYKGSSDNKYENDLDEIIDHSK